MLTKRLIKNLAAVALLLSRNIILLRAPLEDPASLETLKRFQFDIGLHKLGVIYGDLTIACFRLGILNAHIGLLPDYRGRSVMEWSLVQGDATGITVFFIDGGIDTGERIVFRETVSVGHCRNIETAKAYLFGHDAVFFRRALEMLKTPGVSVHQERHHGRTPLLSNVAVADECCRTTARTRN